jgi:MoxR-like ATPase
MPGTVLNIENSIRKITDNIEKVIVGKTQEIRMVMAALLCEGHILVEDVPGVGKTVLARSVAKTMGCLFSRIQFTPDLLPSDITGVNIFNQKTRDFEFKQGPIHSQIVLADEINRATPKTQSALLECMEEYQVTVDGTRYPLPRPFIVIATQNPVEYEGTFPLPESQLDRFFIRVNLGYPGEEAESRILSMQQLHHPIDDLTQVIGVEELLEMQRMTREIHVDESIRQYIVRIVQKTRSHEGVVLGASPRGSLAVFRASQAEAIMSGRNFVIPDDVKKMAPPCISHRMMGRSGGYQFNRMVQVVEDILGEVAVPQ